MLYREIIAVCSEIHTKHINTLCGQNVEFVNVKPGGTCSSHLIYKARNSGAGTVQCVTLEFELEEDGCPVPGRESRRWVL
jgi:hypothetical protein